MSSKKEIIKSCGFIVHGLDPSDKQPKFLCVKNKNSYYFADCIKGEINDNIPNASHLILQKMTLKELVVILALGSRHDYLLNNFVFRTDKTSSTAQRPIKDYTSNFPEKANYFKERFIEMTKHISLYDCINIFSSNFLKKHESILDLQDDVYENVSNIIDIVDNVEEYNSFWEFPKGRIKKSIHETHYIDTALRELNEETGLSTKDITFNCIETANILIEEPTSNKDYKFIFFFGKIKDMENVKKKINNFITKQKNTEIGGVKLLTIEQLREKVKNPQLVEIAEEIYAEYQDKSI